MWGVARSPGEPPVLDWRIVSTPLRGKYQILRIPYWLRWFYCYLNMYILFMTLWRVIQNMLKSTLNYKPNCHDWFNEMAIVIRLRLRYCWMLECSYVAAHLLLSSEHLALAPSEDIFPYVFLFNNWEARWCHLVFTSVPYMLFPFPISPESNFKHNCTLGWQYLVYEAIWKV